MDEATLTTALRTLKSVGDKLAVLTYLRWADFQEAEQEAIAAFDDSPYEPALPARLHWRSYHHSPPDQIQQMLLRELLPAIERLGNKFHNPLATHLHRIGPVVAALAELPAPGLRSLVDWVGEQPFETPRDRRQLLDRFDSILHKCRDKFSGQFFTPPAVVQLLVELAAPAAGERIYDPCFGSAGLLTAAVDYVLRHASDRKTRGSESLLHVSGVEINSSSYTIGLVRLALAGVADPQIELGNSLERTASNNPQSEGFDLVIANPPWGGKVELFGLDHFPIKTNDSAALFVQHALMQLRPGGRAVIVVPPSILFGSGSFQKLRQWLLEQHTVEAVIGLPEGAFQPYTSIKSSILVLRRGGRTRSVRMIDGASILAPLKKSDEGMRLIRPLMAAFVTQLSETRDDKNSWEVPVETLAAIDWDLTPKLRDQSSLELILKSLPQDVPVRRLAEVCTIASGKSYRSHDLQAEPPRSNFEPSGRTLFPEIERAEINPQHPFSFADNPIPYIRGNDLRNSAVSKASTWLGPVAASSVDSKWKLRGGDILLARISRTNRVAIVQNGAIGGIPASSLFVLRVDGSVVDPHYLLAYLESAECNAWLDDRSSSLKQDRRLSQSALLQLPVPLPPLQIQQRVAEQHVRHKVDALTFLAELLSENREEPLAAALISWVDKCLKVAGRFEDDAPFETAIPLLEQVAAVECPVNTCESCGKPYFLDYSTHYLDPPESYERGITTNCLACWLDVGPNSDSVETMAERSPLVPWALAFRDSTRALSKASAISDAPSLLSALQSVQTRLTSTLVKLPGHLPNEEKARRLTRGVISLIERTTSALLDDVRIAVSVTHVLPAENGETNLIVRVTNESRLPLQALSFTTKPKLRHESSTLAYQLPGESDSIQFIGTLPVAEGPVAIELHWTGRNLNGERIIGSRELSLQLTATTERGEPRLGELGASPYVCGDPVKTDRPDVFVGREDLLEQIRRQIVQSGNVVLLEGNRRAGKSSILWHLEGANAVPGWLGVYCSLQGAEGNTAGGIPTAEVFRGIAYEVVQAMRRLNGTAVLPDGTQLDGDRKLGISRSLRKGIGDESPFADFREYLELVLAELAKQNLGLLLMLDEFDKLQEGIDKGVTSPQVPENIRFLVQSYPRFSAILTGSRRLKRLREEYWSALFGLGTRFGVTSLPREPAIRLVTEPVKGRLSFASDAVELVYQLTAGQPYLLQCLCNRIFDLAASERLRSISIDQVQRAAQAMVSDNEHFASLWDYAVLDRRRFLLALIHREASGPDPLRLGVLQEKLTSHGVEVSEASLISDLEFLRELELIDLHGESSGAYYSLTIPMMGDWIECQQDFEVLRSRARAESEDLNE